MKAVVLCAGYGERLKPLTDILPKPLFPVLGHPLLEHIICYLKQFGVNEICVNTHWLAEKIIEYLGDGKKFGVKFHISYEPEILGIGGGIGTMRDFLTDDMFIVHNGDILSNIDIRSAIDFHIKERALCTLILHNYPAFNNVSVVSNNIVDIGDRVQGFKGARVQELAYTGIVIMSNEILNFLPYNKPCSIVDVWVELIKSQPGNLKGYISKLHYWTDIGSIARYLELHRAMLIDRVGLMIDLPSGSIYIGKNTTISDSTKITGFASIGKNCIIEEDVSLENCVVWDNTIVKKGTKAKNIVLCKEDFKD